MSHDDQLDRQMLRHLMRKYTAEDLNRLMQEENTSALSRTCRAQPQLITWGTLQQLT